MSATSACRGCTAERLEAVLSLGATPLANALLTREQLDEPEATYPLDLVFCPACSLLQITETVPSEVLFTDYPYFSSVSDTMLAHAEALAARMVADRGLDGGSRVLEVASNDGYLLRNYVARGVPVLGIEPAANVAAVAEEEQGVPTLRAFFDADLARELAARGKRGDVIHAHNVLAHVAAPDDLLRGIERLLKPGGVAVIEVPYVRDMIENVEFDTIYHEHHCYFSATSLQALFDRAGLAYLDVERVPIHGGSLRVFAGRRDEVGAPTAEVAALLDEERALGIDQAAYYADFALRVDALRRQVRRLLVELHDQGKRIGAYGASAKGSTLLNYFGIGRDRLEFVADRSPVKQGRYTPGTHLEIVPPERLLEAMPDYVLLLTWNFRDEILAQQEAYRAQGGKFIVPIPELEVV